MYVCMCIYIYINCLCISLYINLYIEKKQHVFTLHNYNLYCIYTFQSSLI